MPTLLLSRQVSMFSLPKHFSLLSRASAPGKQHVRQHRKAESELIKSASFFLRKIWPHHKYQCRAEGLNFHQPPLERWETDMFVGLSLDGINEMSTLNLLSPDNSRG